MNRLASLLSRIGVLKNDLDYHLTRSSMVIIFAFFGYRKWFEYEAQALISYSHGPLIFWMYPVFDVRGATYFLGVAEWLFGGLLLSGFWNKRLGFLGALGSCFSFVVTVTIIPFMPDGWAASARGFPAMAERVAFLMKDLVLFAVSFYLLKQDLVRALSSGKQRDGSWITGNKTPHEVVVCKLPELSRSVSLFAPYRRDLTISCSSAIRKEFKELSCYGTTTDVA